MRRYLLLGITTLCLSLGMPVAAQAENIEETVTAAQFEEDLQYITDTFTRYANSANVNIRKEPNTNSEILGQTLLNTSFEAVLDIAGWTMITTEDGYAYIKSDYLSDTEVLYTDEDLYVLAHVIAGEAQPYSDAEQRYVGSVVLNRVNHPEFPNTIKKVVFQKNPTQYSCTIDGNYDREPTEQNWANAKWLLENGSVFPDYVIYQSGGKQGTVYLKTKWHYYCY